MILVCVSPIQSIEAIDVAASDEQCTVCQESVTRTNNPIEHCCVLGKWGCRRLRIPELGCCLFCVVWVRPGPDQHLASGEQMRMNCLDRPGSIYGRPLTTRARVGGARLRLPQHRRKRQ